MSEIALEVVPDPLSPEGGHAVIRLSGIWLLPPRATVRIEPIEDAVDADALADWPYGDWAPVASRVTEAGLDLVVGPAVVDSAPLTEGTPVVVSIPAADIRHELLWPAITPSRAGDTEPVIMSVSEFIALTTRKEPPPLVTGDELAPAVVRSVTTGDPQNATVDVECTDGNERSEASRESGVPAAAGLARALPSSHPGVPQVRSARKRQLAAVMLPAILLGIAGVGAWLALRSPGSPVPTAVSPGGSNDKAAARNEAWWAEAERQRLLSETNRKSEEDNRKALEEKRKTEEVKRKAEEEKRSAEEAKRKAEQEKRVAEEEKHRVAVEEAARAAAKVAAQKAADSADRQVQGASSAADATPEDYRRAALATAKRIAEQERQANGRTDR